MQLNASAISRTPRTLALQIDPRRRSCSSGRLRSCCAKIAVRPHASACDASRCVSALRLPIEAQMDLSMLRGITTCCRLVSVASAAASGAQSTPLRTKRRSSCVSAVRQDRCGASGGAAPQLPGPCAAQPRKRQHFEAGQSAQRGARARVQKWRWCSGAHTCSW